MWGGAAAVVYGTIQALRDMVDVIAEVESSMAQLRKVMNPVTTDFMMIQRAGVEMAKEFGVPIEQVVDAMRVFAQQGLAQQEVLDRTRISTLAANVTTLQAAEATEALTAAVKVYDTQGRGTVKFLDSWLEVESKHAITSRELALALQRAGAAAKNAGIDFDELNAIVTGIGVTTRQTGKEIGTSVRFIARRLTSAKAPAELAKLGIAAFGETGDIRSAFAIMGDLAMKWEELTQAQRLNIAMAIGGRRHYNSILVLMDNWEEVTATLAHSQNSQGASMQRNLIIMETFRKKLTQLGETVKQTQLLFGEFALEHAKTLIDAMRVLLQAVNDIPPVMKKAAVGIATTFVLLHKGAGLVDRFADSWSKFVGVVGSFKAGASGLGFAGDILKTFKDAKTAKSIFDIKSSLGKLWFTILDVGRSFNKFVAGFASGIAKFSLFKSAFFAIAASVVGVTGVLAPLAAIFTKFSKSGLVVAGVMSTVALGFSKLGDAGTGALGSLGPLLATLTVAYKTLSPFIKRFRESNQSALDFAESQKLAALSLQTQSKDIKNHIVALDQMRKKRDELSETGELPAPVAREAFLSEETKASREFADAIATVMPEAIAGFDKYGRAILSSTEQIRVNLKTLGFLYDEMQRMKQLEIAERAVHDLTAANEGMERFKKVIRDTVKSIPLLGKALSQGIKVAPIIDLRETIAEERGLRQAAAETPFSVVYDKPIADAQKRIKELRGTIASTVKLIQESLAQAPMGDTLSDITMNLQAWKREFEILAEYMSSGEVSFAWEDLLAAEAFSREGSKIKESGESTYAYLKSLGFKVKENRKDIEDSFKEGGKSLNQAIKEGLVDPLQFTAAAGDIVLYTRQMAKEFDIAAGAARLSFDETGKAVVEFIRKSTGDWAKEDFSDEMQKFALAIFSPADFQRAVEKGIKQINAVIAGAAAGIAYPAPIDLGARFFSQIPTEQLLASGFGALTTPTTGAAPTFGRPAAKEDVELEYDKYLNILREYKLSQEALTKTQQDALNIGAKVAPEVMQRFLALQQVLLNESAVMNYKAVIVDLNKAFEEGSRNLQTALRQARMAAEFDVFQTGILAGRQRELPAMTAGPVGAGELNLQQFAQLVSPDYEKILNLLNEANLQRAEVRDRMDKAAQAQDDLRYLEDLYLAQGSLIQQKDFAEFSDFLQQTDDKNTRLILTELLKQTELQKAISQHTGMTAGVATEEAQAFELTDETINKIASVGFGEIARSAAAADPSRVAASLSVDALEIGGEKVDFEAMFAASSLFDSAAQHLSQMDPSEILSRYREEVTKIGTTGFVTDQQAATIDKLTELFAKAFGKSLGPGLTRGGGLDQLVAKVAKETPPEIRQLIDTGLPEADIAVGPFAESQR
ncbi:MAG: phage tail tape measure protein, partial [Anaerolineales bacterium]|nr:phage tail tape measure protein [Anaerolineales bacterium]